MSPCPDSTSRSVFKKRLLLDRGKEPLAKLLAHVVGLAQEKGIVLGLIQVVYSVHRVADVNVARGKGPGGKISRRAVAIDDPGKAVLPWTYMDKEAG